MKGNHCCATEDVKLAIVTETFPPEINGIAMSFGVIARQLGRRGHAVTVHRPWRPDLAAAASHPEHCAVPMPGVPLPGYDLRRVGLPGRRRLERRWRVDRPDLVHVVTEGPLGASADIYIRASLTKTFGNVLTEAMASGLAVAAFDYAAARQFVRHGENGLAVPCREPETLVAAAIELATDPSLRLRLRAAAPASLGRYAWEEIVQRFESELAAAARIQ